MMKMINRFLIGVGALVLLAALVMALQYPEQSVAIVIGMIMGITVGMIIQNSLHKASFNQGAEMTQDLQKKILANPAAIMRETRLAEENINKSHRQTSTISEQQPIPRITMTGLN